MRIQTPVVRLQQCGRPQPINREPQSSPSSSYYIQQRFHPLTDFLAARSLSRVLLPALSDKLDAQAANP